MRLKHLWIEKFKNLENFKIDFSDSPYCVLVGQNGSGKSNLFEALLKIFDSVEWRGATKFRYKLEYICRGQLVQLECNPDKRRFRTTAYSTKLGAPESRRRVPLSELTGAVASESGRLLPEFVFGYYSGLCCRFKEPFDEYQQAYTRWVRKCPPGQTIPRRLLYGSLSLADILLLALYAHELHDGKKSPILDVLGISGVADVQMRLLPPERYDRQRHEYKTMGLEGLMLDLVNYLNLAVEGEPVPTGEGVRAERKYRFLNDGLKKLAEMSVKRGSNLFSLLFEARQQRILSGLSFNLELQSQKQIQFDDLSEGEKQLLLVMGMLRFAEHGEALFLLDEPDTHLNPVWSLKYMAMAEEEMKHKPSGHIVMATHDPLMFAGLSREDVRILNRVESKNEIRVDIPDRDPKGTGIPAILMSDIFGLRSVLDLETQKLLDEKRRLAIKDDRDRTPEETEQLKKLNQQLRDIDVSQMASDPLYPHFVRWVVGHKDYEKLRSVFLDEEQRTLRDKIAQEVAEALGQSVHQHEIH